MNHTIKVEESTSGVELTLTVNGGEPISRSDAEAAAIEWAMDADFMVDSMDIRARGSSVNITLNGEYVHSRPKTIEVSEF